MTWKQFLGKLAAGAVIPLVSGMAYELGRKIVRERENISADE